MSEPNLWIGVDLGMTYTGVAYAARGWNEAKLIQEWPGKEGEFQSKVPTLLTYTNRGALSSWGFQCEDPDESDDPDKKERRWFKLLLDEAVLKDVSSKYTVDDVQKWYEDFLGKLYNHIESIMKTQQGTLWKGKVQFLFSVPTTWNQATLNLYQQAIKNAGFGKEKRHKVSVTWTEAQAAAIYTAKEREYTFRKNDVLLVCDAGGGTTDLAILEQIGNVAEGEVTQLKELGKVVGVPAGSTRIDNAYYKHVVECLSLLAEKHPDITQRLDDPESIAEQMMKGRFQTYKCSFGTAIGDLPKYRIAIPGLSSSFSSTECGIESGKLMLSIELMADFFEQQLNDVFKAIDDRLSSLQQQNSTREKQVDYLVLSGGLGSSAYVKKQIEKRYLQAPGSVNFHNISNLQIFRADEPRLAVVKGLVLDQMQDVSVGQSVMKTFYSRTSYGFLHVEKYDEERHIRQDIFEDWDGEIYVGKQIKWVVKKGDGCSKGERIKYHCERKIDPEGSNPLKGWKTTIVISSHSRENLQTNLSQDGVEELCVLESDLSQFDLDGGDFKYSKPSRFSFTKKKKKAYYTAKYEIHVVLAPANITFELWFKGRKCGERSISVTWGPGASAPVDPEVKDILDPN